MASNPSQKAFGEDVTTMRTTAREPVSTGEVTVWDDEATGGRDPPLFASSSQTDILTQQPELTQMGDLEENSQDSQLLWSPGEENQEDTIERPWGRIMPIRGEGKSFDLKVKKGKVHTDDGVFSLHTIGRSTQCDISLALPRGMTQPEHIKLQEWAFGMISNNHCKIYGLPEEGKSTKDCLSVSDYQIFIEDSSQNGTVINKNVLLRRGEKRALHSGDEICLVNPQTLRKKVQKRKTLQDILEYHTYVFIRHTQNNRNNGTLKKQRGGMVDIKAMRWHSTTSSNPTIPMFGKSACGSRRRSPRRQPTRRMEEEYDVRDLLGTGTVGEVRRAIHRKSGTERAIKIIKSQRNRWQAHLDQTTATFEAEASILRELQHPYIVNLVDVFVTPQAVYIVMDLLQGGDLFDRIVAKGHYTEVEARRVMRRLFSAIHYLHQDRNIVHRDIKPENILLVSRDNDVEVQLTDFGLAKALNGDEGLKTFCGTPQYFAPEVLRRRHTVAGRGRYGKQADMWSVGIVLYVLLSGVPPFDVNESIDVVADAKIEFPDPEWENVSQDAKDLVLQLLAADPALRITISQACNHSWILTQDGDTHVHPLDNPRLEACSKKRLFLDSASERSHHGEIKSDLEKAVSDTACSSTNRETKDTASKLSPSEKESDTSRSNSKSNGKFTSLSLTVGSHRKNRSQSIKSESNAVTPAVSNRRKSAGSKSSRSHLNYDPLKDTTNRKADEDILSFFSEKTDSIASFSTEGTIVTKCETSSPMPASCSLANAVGIDSSSEIENKTRATKRRITDSLESIFSSGDHPPISKPKKRRRASASKPTPKRNKRSTKAKPSTPPSTTKQTKLSTWFRKVN